MNSSILAGGLNPFSYHSQEDTMMMMMIKTRSPEGLVPSSNLKVSFFIVDKHPYNNSSFTKEEGFENNIEEMAQILFGIKNQPSASSSPVASAEPIKIDADIAHSSSDSLIDSPRGGSLSPTINQMGGSSGGGGHQISPTHSSGNPFTKLSNNIFYSQSNSFSSIPIPSPRAQSPSSLASSTESLSCDSLANSYSRISLSSSPSQSVPSSPPHFKFTKANHFKPIVGSPLSLSSGSIPQPNNLSSSAPSSPSPFTPRSGGLTNSPVVRKPGYPTSPSPTPPIPSSVMSGGNASSPRGSLHTSPGGAGGSSGGPTSPLILSSTPPHAIGIAPTPVIPPLHFLRSGAGSVDLQDDLRKRTSIDMLISTSIVDESDALSSPRKRRGLSDAANNRPVLPQSPRQQYSQSPKQTSSPLLHNLQQPLSPQLFHHQPNSPRLNHHHHMVSQHHHHHHHHQQQNYTEELLIDD
ncbi:hypothetical protein DFA_11717 [Cavenderia fasciculata]|uniref:Uncharacterized protein n=1 Tax=Cavenderia fasciculata TaxID=261658 RepID=F4QE09_CACFS|nr:uncharacterized protein DFA_11717 [Cavenderia fasciculata]EGG13956.1 hypothetical protein DFA_11717 [Cavenderia fasciculata]|eukprot:XP_004350664.1 hypothetical protein DFA_11717 [Cavenderia fasciculata]